jgi:putative transposase
MKKKRFTEEQIIAMLREQEAGAEAADLSRKYAVSETTLYNWKAEFGGMDVSETERLKALEEENARRSSWPIRCSMRRRFASSWQKNGRARLERVAVAHLRAVMGLSERRTCRIVAIDRKTARYASTRPADGELRAELRDLANARRRFGYRRLFVLLRQQGEPSGKVSNPREFSAHGLRSGYLIEAARAGLPLQEAMQQSRHHSVQQAARYYNEGEIARGRAARLG